MKKDQLAIAGAVGSITALALAGCTSEPGGGSGDTIVVGSVTALSGASSTWLCG
jgi:hypothetical protein